MKNINKNEQKPNFRPFYHKDNLSIKKVNQQHSLLIACVLSEFNPTGVKVLLNL